MANKLTIEDARRVFSEHGFMLISTEYVNSYTKLKAWCSKHGEFECSVARMKRAKYGCIKCTHEAFSENSRLSNEEVTSLLNKHDLSLGKDEYINSYTKMEFICPKHGAFISTLSVIKQGSGCPKCSNELKSIKRTLPISEVKSRIEKLGFTWISGEYKEKRSRLNLLCPIHGEFNASLEEIENGFGCHECSMKRFHENNSGKNNHNWNGGSSGISGYLRHKIKPWSIQQIIKSGHKSEISGRKSNLRVHHMTPFCEIRDLTIKELGFEGKEVDDYTYEDLVKLSDKFIENNEKYAKPVVLTADEHKKFHSFCGGYRVRTTMEKLMEFKSKIKDVS